MSRLQEVKTLIENIQSEGPFQIVVNNDSVSDEFGAYWDYHHRTICISLNRGVSEGSIIGSILFEMHNAVATSKFNHIERLVTSRQLNREGYVRAVEFIEYENSLKASEITRKGIALGLFPQDAFLPTYRNFEEHFFFQRQGGHSAVISQNFDHLVLS